MDSTKMRICKTDDYKAFLLRFSLPYNEIKVREEGLRRRGEYFSIFRGLMFSKPEVQFHSRILFTLLSPRVEHGLEDAPLRAFVEMIRRNFNASFKFECSKAIVQAEYGIGKKDTKTDGTSTGGQIDLVIEDGKGNAIIIENKYGADDQECQIERYNNYAKQTYSKGNYIVLYLTPDGHDASTTSKGVLKQGLDYFCLSYNPTSTTVSIMPWLKECTALATSRPLIRETIRQYTNFLNRDFQIMKNDYQEKLAEFLSKDENAIYALEIGNLYQDICINIRKRFLEKIKKLATEKYGLTEVKTDVVNLCYMQGDVAEMRMHTARQTGCTFRIGFDRGPKEVYYTVQNTDYGNIIIPQDNSLFHCDDTSDEFPFGLVCFKGPNGEPWYDWNNLDTLIDMANGRFIEEIDKIFAKLRDSGIIEKYL